MLHWSLPEVAPARSDNGAAGALFRAASLFAAMFRWPRVPGERLETSQTGHSKVRVSAAQGGIDETTESHIRTPQCGHVGRVIGIDGVAARLMMGIGNSRRLGGEGAATHLSARLWAIFRNSARRPFYQAGPRSAVNKTGRLTDRRIRRALLSRAGAHMALCREIATQCMPIVPP